MFWNGNGCTFKVPGVNNGTNAVNLDLCFSKCSHDYTSFNIGIYAITYQKIIANNVKLGRRSQTEFPNIFSMSERTFDSASISLTRNVT